MFNIEIVIRIIEELYRRRIIRGIRWWSTFISQNEKKDDMLK